MQTFRLFDRLYIFLFVFSICLSVSLSPCLNLSPTKPNIAHANRTFSLKQFIPYFTHNNDTHKNPAPPHRFYCSQSHDVKWRCASGPPIRGRARNAAKSIDRRTRCAHIWRTSTPSVRAIDAFSAERSPSLAIHCTRTCRASIAASPPRICPCCRCRAHSIRNWRHSCSPRPA